MSDLELTIDKFSFRVADDRLYGAEDLWVLPLGAVEDGTARVRVGLTDFLQRRSGDAAFVHVTPVGTRVEVGADVAELETVKVNLGLPSPVAGTIVAVNAALDAAPETVNQEPYGAGWLAELSVPAWEAAKATLLAPRAYYEQMKRRAEAELASS